MPSTRVMCLGPGLFSHLCNANFSVSFFVVHNGGSIVNDYRMVILVQHVTATSLCNGGLMILRVGMGGFMTTMAGS